MGITGEGSSQDAEGSMNCKRNSGTVPYYNSGFDELYPNLFTRRGKIGNAKVRATFFDALKPIQQKGRRGVPISLQDKIDKEIDQLIKEGHIIKMQDCLDKHFVFPMTITVKEDGSIKLALEPRELNKQVNKK